MSSLFVKSIHHFNLFLSQLTHLRVERQGEIFENIKKSTSSKNLKGNEICGKRAGVC